MLVNSPLAEIAYICAREIREGLTPQAYFCSSQQVGAAHAVGKDSDPDHLYVGRVLKGQEALDTFLDLSGIADFSQTFPFTASTTEVIFTCAVTQQAPFVFVGYRIPLYQ